MFFKLLNKKILILLLALFISGCGTKFTCSPEIGAPPERSFWCSPLLGVGKFFTVQKNYKDSDVKRDDGENKRDILCEKTIGDKECNNKE